MLFRCISNLPGSPPGLASEPFFFVDIYNKGVLVFLLKSEHRLVSSPSSIIHFYFFFYITHKHVSGHKARAI